MADQVVKWVMSAWIGPDAAQHRVDLIGNFLAFEYVENSGAAFGILAGQPLLLAIFAVLAVVLFIGMMRSTLRTHPLVPIAVGMVLGGAIGNLLDRIRLGYVVDFVAVGTFPRFNVADSAITVGLVLLAWTALREDAAPGHADPVDHSPERDASDPSTPPMKNGSHA
ncbi:MAG: signal peptidase II [Thermomicrobiales bacterium]